MWYRAIRCPPYRVGKEKHDGLDRPSRVVDQKTVRQCCPQSDNMPPERPTRRQFLAGAGAATTAGLAGCLGVGESVYSPGEDADSEWPMPAYDRGSSGYNPDAAAPRDGVTERWSVQIPAPSARPVVAEGLVFIPTRAGVVALELDTGDERWRYGEESPWPASPVVHDGVVFVGFADQLGLVALSAEDGSEQWRVDTRGAIRASPTLGYDGHRVFVGDDTGKLYQVVPDTGEVENTAEVFGPVSTLAHERSLLVGTESGEVYSLFEHHDTLTGLWRRKLDGAVTDVAVADAVISIATFGGPMYRLQDGAHAGSSRWESDSRAKHLAATPYHVYGSDAGGLDALHYRTGEAEWKRDDGEFNCAPAVAGDTLYVGNDASVEAYALNSGVAGVRLRRRRWSHAVESRVVDGIAVADGAVFAVTRGNDDAPAKAHALDPA